MHDGATCYDYDLIVIGSGPGGQRAAIQAAKLGRRTLIVERQTVVGGVCINTGTIPSKTLREAVMHLSGFREQKVYGASNTMKRNITMGDLHVRTDFVIRNEIEVTRHQLLRNQIDLAEGAARFIDAHRICIDSPASGMHQLVTAEKFVIAVGTVATRDPSIPFDGQHIVISDDILGLQTLPRSLTVIGAGVIGIEYATMFAILGVRVTLVDKRDRMLPFIDREIMEHLAYQMHQNRVMLRLGEEVSGVEKIQDDRGTRVNITLASGKQIISDMVLYSIGRTGATAALDLPAAGLSAEARGHIVVNEHLQTTQPHIYAVGDVIGFPSLASTSMEQGRMAACHAFGQQCRSTPNLFPYGIYTIPEISMVGRTEEDLTREGVPYEVGKANYREIARGQILGDRPGLLKLLFHRETRLLLGVHIIGDGATELIHIGQAVLALGGTIDYFVDTVFNYPTLAECYKTAAFDGVNRLG